MKIITWNVNGLRAVWKKNFLEFVAAESPDLLCIQESKLQADQLTDEMKCLLGYRDSWFHHAEKKGYSGVGTWAKTLPLSTSSGIGIDRFDSEGRVLVHTYPDFTLLNIYFPNGQMSDDRLAYKLDFYEALQQYCNNLRATGHSIIVCGDVNTAHQPMDLKNDKANEKTSGFLPIEREWIDRFIADGYTDVFRYLYPDKVQYSWWSYRFSARERNTGWRIDYFFVSDDLLPRIKDCRILDDVQGSDHCPVLLELE